MSKDRLEEHRRIWDRKPVLERIYGVWFDALLRLVPPGARAVEVGAGPGFLTEHARSRRPDVRWVATDLEAAPWNDAAADAHRLPFRTGTAGAVLGLDLVHHLARPGLFFGEAARVLTPGGRLAVVEPWVTWLSYPVYRWLHHEGCTPDLDPTEPFKAARAEAKDPFQGDAAVLWRLVRQTTSQGWADYGFRPPRVTVLNGFAYLLSLGFRQASLLPQPLLPFFLDLDERASRLAPYLGLRALAVWERERGNGG